MTVEILDPPKPTKLVAVTMSVEQAKALAQPGVQVIREGEDPLQVNARRAYADLQHALSHAHLVYLLLVLALFIFPSFVQAQTIPVISAGVKAVFTASPDHNVVVEGNPSVLNYILDTIVMTRPVQTGPLVGGALALSLPLGKPTPDASNTISVAVPTLFSGLTNGVYTSTVTAVGPGGAMAVSVSSDPFLKLGAPRAAGKPSIVGQ